MLKLGEIFFKYRDYTPIPFIIVMFIYADVNTLSIQVGAAMMVLGELIRIHGVAYIGGISRTRTFSTNTKVITGGPFSHVRNPLYVGNLFLSAGLVVFANSSVPLFENNPHYFTLLFVVVFFLQYIPMIWWEESNLTERLGQDYVDYKSQVPRWIPLLFGKKIGDNEKIEGDYKMAIKSEKSTLITTFIIILVALWRSGYLPF